MIEGMKMMPRPAFVLGPPGDPLLIRKTGLARASFIAVREPLGNGRQHAIDSFAAFIERFSFGR